MTAISLFPSAGAACILADQGGFAADGTLLKIETKIATSEKLAMAIGHNGIATSDTAGLICAWFARQRSQAGALAGLPALVAELRDDLDSVEGDDRNGHETSLVQLFVAAWLPGQIAGLFAIGSDGGTFGPTYQPGTLRRVSSVVSPPVPEAYHPIRPGFVAATGCRRLIEKQRLGGIASGFCLVGGGGELVTVGEAGGSRETLVTWPDRLGERIAA